MSVNILKRFDTQEATSVAPITTPVKRTSDGYTTYSASVEFDGSANQVTVTFWAWNGINLVPSVITEVLKATWANGRRITVPIEDRFVGATFTDIDAGTVTCVETLEAKP